jgi:hypothetical protein
VIPSGHWENDKGEGILTPIFEQFHIENSYSEELTCFMFHGQFCSELKEEFSEFI